jgi:hypothetical protein
MSFLLSLGTGDGRVCPNSLALNLTTTYPVNSLLWFTSDNDLLYTYSLPILIPG